MDTINRERMNGRRRILTMLLLLAACRAADDAPPLAPRTFLFLGNSITAHGPDSTIGWSGAWGMAASDASRDYVHALLQHYPGARHTEVGIAQFERDYLHYDLRQLDPFLADRPDVVVLEVGDNVVDSSAVGPSYRALVDHVTARTSGVVLCVSTWWNNHATNAVIRDACSGARTRYVDVSGLWADTANRASAERSFVNAAVADHPGDLGMARIAGALYDALRR